MSDPQNDRATSADADWLQEYFEDDEWSPEAQERIRRILNSLRAQREPNPEVDHD